MTTLVHDPDHTARGVARVIDRYRKPRTSALLASWLGELQETEDALWQLLVERSLATAEGDQLDVLGAIVGEPRQGRDDETYRIWISARNMVNRSSGTTTEELAIARKLLPPEVAVVLEEYYPAAFVMRAYGVLDSDDAYQIARMLHLAKAAGVQFAITWPTDPAGGAGTFAFAPTVGTPVLGSPIGFDAGVWAAVADGTWLPPEVEAPEGVVAGQIVVQGVPVVVQGVPLVLRPPVTVARDVRVVPRPLALPAPSVVDSVELVDTFADASLEMTPAGDMFRVALEVQSAVHAMRFSVTLRTTTVTSAAYEEIGVLRFESAAFPAGLVLVAELEVSASGQTVDLQLYNLTAAAVVATLSSTSTVTEKRSAAVSLSSAEALYSVRLRRTGGTADQPVSCRSVVLETNDD
jgi:hypothetical protein